MCNKPIYRIGLAKKNTKSVLKSTKIEYRNIGISISTAILANIGLKWYNQVEANGLFCWFCTIKVPNIVKILSHSYLTSTKLCEIDVSKILVSHQKHRIGFQKPISPSTTTDCHVWHRSNVSVLLSLKDVGQLAPLGD